MTFKAMILDGEGFPEYPCKDCPSDDGISVCRCSAYSEYIEKLAAIPMTIQLAHQRAQTYYANLGQIQRLERDNEELATKLFFDWNITKEELEA